MAAVRHTVFDGIGSFHSYGYVSTAGTIVKFTLNGTYTVNPDCSMTAGGTSSTQPPNSPPATFFGVIAADSNKIFQLRTDANTETIVFERIESAGQNENSQ